MSEFQYYEFQAIDRPLDQKAMKALRDISTRAHISPTRFVNTYSYGDLKADPADMVARYFDVFVYVANWGTHRVLFRLPREPLDLEATQPYCTEETVSAWHKGDHLLIDLSSREEGDSGWVEEEEAEGWLPGLLPVRDELLAGDLRGLYIGWLAGVEAGEVADDELEPPVPGGLGTLTEALVELAGFLRVDPLLIEVAAEASATATSTAVAADELAAWIKSLPAGEKDEVVLRLIQGEPHLGRVLLQRCRKDLASQQKDTRTVAPPSRRTVGRLLEVWEGRREEKRRQEAERVAREKEHRRREEALQRARHLDSLVGREDKLWREVESAVASKAAKQYDHAVSLLQDLRDLAERGKQREAFDARLARLRQQHGAKRTFIERLNTAALSG